MTSKRKSRRKVKRTPSASLASLLDCIKKRLEHHQERMRLSQRAYDNAIMNNLQTWRGYSAENTHHFFEVQQLSAWLAEFGPPTKKEKS